MPNFRTLYWPGLTAGQLVDAEKIGITDTGGLVTATEVEGAIAELATNIATTLGGGGGGLANVVEDTTPQLGGDLDLNGNVITGMVIGTDVQAHSSVLAATTASFTTADETKLDWVSVTQAVDLDAIETRVNALDASVVLMGTWDASVGTFPGSGTAQAGESWIVSVGGTVDSVVFSANDRLVAIVDNASTTVYATNWHQLDYTDAVLSVNGSTGAVTVQAHSSVLDATTASFTTADETKLDGIEALADVTDTTNVAAAGAVMGSLVDAKGDLLAGSADDTVVRVAAGTDGQILSANSAQASGLEWITSGSGGLGNVVEDTTPQLGGALDAVGNVITGAPNYGTVPVDLGTVATATNIDVTAGAYATVELGTGPTVTFTPTGGTAGNQWSTTVEVTQNATTARTVAFGGSITWVGGVAFAVDTTLSSQSWFSLIWTGTEYIGIAGIDALANVVEDTTPQLGGDLDLNTHVITGMVIGTDVQAHSAVLDATTASFLTADETKLDGIEALADVTDTANVTAAGALMDSEVDANIKTLALPASTTISAFGATLVDDADAAAARVTLDAVGGNAGETLKIEKITQAAYTALGTPVATTLYLIVG